MDSVRWNVAVSADTDKSLRMFIAGRGGRKGDLSHVIEEAVRSYIFEQTAHQIKTANKGIKEGEMDEMIEEALDWARRY
ncbi:MAG: ribbon-helix-helix domain-containing protein [Synergistaceae bacterium]|jgi:hypothetical protein|nr:ribbon-helix-helix domain-containing protein [Synergistaceae bacterium]